MLCGALLLCLLPAPARALTLTAVNDTLLPVDESTMPARLGGEMYVPYSVFTSLGVSASQTEDGVLSLTSGSETLHFSPSEGYVYDQSLNSYSSPAYDRNGTVYVPVKLCCGKFGLNYSTLSFSGETVLRVTDSSAQSDAAFTSAQGDRIQSAINAYRGVPSGGSGGSGQNTPAEPPIPPVEEQPSQKPARVYLTFYGAPNAQTADVLDALRQAGRTASFFLPTDSSQWRDDAVRRLVAEGHTPALLFDPSTDFLASLRAANERLSLLTGASTRIVTCEAGCNTLTREQRDALVHAGYRLWDAAYDCGDTTQSAERAYATTAQMFAGTSATVVLRLHHSAATAQTVRLLCGYISRQSIPTSRITLGTTPINSASDTR